MHVKRQVGIGDVGHVRGSLLSVAIIFPESLQQQLQGAILAAEALKMRVRVQAVVPDAGVGEELNTLMTRYQAGDHQLLTYVGQVPVQQLLTCEIVLEPDVEENITAEAVRDGIIDTWNYYGGRFANGNFGRLSVEELTERYITNANSI
jgi:hypothetical protein